MSQKMKRHFSLFNRVIRRRDSYRRFMDCLDITYLKGCILVVVGLISLEVLSGAERELLPHFDVVLSLALVLCRRRSKIH